MKGTGAGRIILPPAPRLPQRYSCPNPQTCEYLRLHGKREWRLQMELKLLVNWSQVILEYLGGPNVITRVLKRGGRQKRDKDVNMEEEWLGRRCCGFEDWGRGPWAKESWWPLESWKRQENRLPYCFQKGAQPCRHLGFSSMRPMLHFLPSHL